jgi:hypothetical protein
MYNPNLLVEYIKRKNEIACAAVLRGDFNTAKGCLNDALRITISISVATASLEQDTMILHSTLEAE